MAVSNLWPESVCRGVLGIPLLDKASCLFGFLVSKVQSLLVSKFLGLEVSWFIVFKVSWLQSFKVSMIPAKSHFMFSGRY